MRPRRLFVLVLGEKSPAVGGTINVFYAGKEVEGVRTLCDLLKDLELLFRSGHEQLDLAVLHELTIDYHLLNNYSRQTSRSNLSR